MRVTASSTGSPSCLPPTKGLQEVRGFPLPRARGVGGLAFGNSAKLYVTLGGAKWRTV